MKSDWRLILILILIILLLIAFKKPIKKIMSRGYKNNNPGNIRLTATKWQGEVDGSDKAFKTFKSMPYGYRAIYALLREYINKGYNTIEKIINRYAPGSENNTEAYINTVVKKTGINKKRVLTFQEINEITDIVAAISFVENGITANIKEIANGYKLLIS
jgi:hypothetical protein